MSIKPKEHADAWEGVRLAFNHLRLIDACKLENGYRHLESRINAESDLRSWFHSNLDGLPEPEPAAKLNRKPVAEQ